MDRMGSVKKKEADVLVNGIDGTIGDHCYHLYLHRFYKSQITHLMIPLISCTINSTTTNLTKYCSPLIRDRHAYGPYHENPIIGTTFVRYGTIDTRNYLASLVFNHQQPRTSLSSFRSHRILS